VGSGRSRRLDRQWPHHQTFSGIDGWASIGETGGYDGQGWLVADDAIPPAPFASQHRSSPWPPPACSGNAAGRVRVRTPGDRLRPARLAQRPATREGSGPLLASDTLGIARDRRKPVRPVPRGGSRGTGRRQSTPPRQTSPVTAHVSVAKADDAPGKGDKRRGARRTLQRAPCGCQEATGHRLGDFAHTRRTSGRIRA
jgi:hypothetical protein